MPKRMTTILLDLETDRRLDEMLTPEISMSEFIRRLINREWYRQQIERCKAEDVAEVCKVEEVNR